MHTKGLTTLCLAAAWALPQAAMAGNFIGLGQPGPQGWSAQLYPTWSKPQASPATASAFAELSYFTPTGFTGTPRDRHQFWAAASAGHTRAAAGSGDSATGIMGQQLAYEYYYNAIEKRQGDALTWWTTPYASVTFPNGSRKASGFGAGGNQYSYLLGWNNYIGWGRWSITFAPVLLSYSARARHATHSPGGGLERQRAGLSLTLADTAIGYRVTPQLDLGIHHSYSIYNHARSDFAPLRQGRLGPSFAYLGLMKPYNIYVAGNLSFDYHASAGMKKATSLSAVVIRFF